MQEIQQLYMELVKKYNDVIGRNKEVYINQENIK
jgi:hypothetical protein